jgi:GNAT superfamily N-acetyltransferase
MIYYSDENIVIRDLQESDAQIITDEEIAQGWHQTIDKYLTRLKDQADGVSINLVAEYKGQVAGYNNVYPGRKAGPFQHGLWPEIVDFGVLEKYRCNGIGTKLMDVAEEIAARYADTVYLGVGLYCSYGAAQRMYNKRGYILDGTGVWYGREQCDPYENYCVDDDLILYLTKKLR